MGVILAPLRWGWKGWRLDSRVRPCDGWGARSVTVAVKTNTRLDPPAPQAALAGLASPGHWGRWVRIGEAMKAHEINELEALDELKIAIWLVKNRVDAFDEDFDETFLSDDLAMMPDQLRAALETAARILLRAKNHHDTMLAIHQHEWCRERDDAKAAAFRSRQQAAHAAVAAAIQSGSLVRPTHCDECPEQADNIVAHHDDYGKPLDVKWLCRSCHGKHHAEHGSAT